MDWYFIFLAVVPSFSFFLPFSFLSPPSPPFLSLPPSPLLQRCADQVSQFARAAAQRPCLLSECRDLSVVLGLGPPPVHAQTGTPPGGCGIHTHRYTSWWLWYPHTHTWVQTCIHICPLIPSPLTCSQVQKPVWGLLVQERRAPQLFQCLKRTPASRFIRYQREVTVYALDE